MTFHVVLQRMAVADLQSYYDYTAVRSPIDAGRWLDRFQLALQTLCERPDRCSKARENGKVDAELWEFLWGKRPYVFRVIFTIDGDKVRILRVLRAQRRPLGIEDMQQSLTDDKPVE